MWVRRMKKEKKEQVINEELAVMCIGGQPETAIELINKYGTYEIQPTNDSENDFPKIAQGLPDAKFRKLDKD